MLTPETALQLHPIGIIRTPYSEKFGIPRQPGLVPQATGLVELFPEFNQTGIFDGLELCSHVWVMFWFHDRASDWTPKVRPPRLGGNEKLGVFATRSPRRPNPIGLSVCEIQEIDPARNLLTLAGVDILDGTPILDIKPYVPYCDHVPEARCQFATDPPKALEVQFSPEAQSALASHPELQDLVKGVLSQDPRPAYHDDERSYGALLRGRNVRWRVEAGTVLVESVE